MSEKNYAQKLYRPCRIVVLRVALGSGRWVLAKLEYCYEPDFTQRQSV
jgi:hypothetical protein